MKKIVLLLNLIFLLFVFSCKNSEQNIAVVWSSKPEFARYCEIFNASQNEYKVIARYSKNVSNELLNTEHTKAEVPDLVIDCWLKGSAVRKNFINLNSLLDEKDTAKINPNIFYTELLDLGKSGSEQLFLPVSFNLPVIIFRDLAIVPSNEFSMSLEEMKSFAEEYNSYDKNVYTKMGFAPIWNAEFLYLVAKGGNADFEENGDSFSWSENSIQAAVTALRKYTSEINTSTTAETDFQFKYLYNNPYSAVMSGRCLFQYLRSDELLMLSKDKMPNIDFRWLSFDKKTPLDDEIVYAGIFKDAKNKKAAKAFLTFLFSEETQKLILDENANTELSTLGFGIAGGFSSVRPITENIFPKYYPLLLSHLPQSKNFMSPHVLPNNWLDIKSEIIIPYLKEACEVNSEEPSIQFSTLEKYINGIKAK